MSVVRFCLSSLVVGLFIFLPTTVTAQESFPSTTVTGGLHIRFAYGNSAESVDAGLPELERVGVGIRRARLRFRLRISEKAGFFIQLEGNSGNASFLDSYAFYQVNDDLELRAGRFAAAQPRSYILTSYSLIDAIERANIGTRWASSTTGSSGRDFGIAARYTIDRTLLTLFLHNGDDSWDRARSNYRETVAGGAVTRRIERTDMALSGAIRHRLAALEGSEVGGFASINTTRNPNTAAEGSDLGRKYASYGAHAYWGITPGSQALRIKLDFLATQYGETGPVEAQTAIGFSGFLATRLTDYSEAFARVELYNSDAAEGDSGDLYITAGASMSLSKMRGEAYARERLTLAYSTLQPDRDGLPTQQALILQIQFLF